MEPHPNPAVAFAAPAGSAEDDWLVRARDLIERAIRRRWADGLITRDPDGIFTAVLGAEHVEKLMAAPRPLARDQLVRDFAYSPETALGDLITRLALTPTEGDLLALLLGCETDPATARLVGYLGGNQAQHTLTFDLVYEIIYRGRAERPSVAAALMHGDLSPHGAARRLRFLIVDGAEQRVTLAQGLRLHPRLTAWLLGRRSLDADLTTCARLRDASDEPPTGEADPAHVDAACAAFEGGGRLLVVTGPPRSGRELVLQLAAHRLGRPLLVVRGRKLGGERLVAAFREATLHRALLAFSEPDEAVADDAIHRFEECLDVFGETVALITPGQLPPQITSLRAVTPVVVPVPAFDERAALWRRYLGDAAGLSDGELTEAAGLYNLGVGGIVLASAAARERASFEKRSVVRSDLGHAVRMLFEADLAAVATRVEVSQTWDDVVLPDELGEAVISILDRIRFRHAVLGNWGFARKVGKGLGLTVLFSGEPGTGKSMVAGLMARELGLDLYVVDLARLTSKWLGETEKNLSRAFDAAEAGHVLLLFDEADTVLGKRSADIRNSNDRNANLETNFILARLEQFQGIAFFTTNLASAIDAAVSRRMSANVKFPFPDVEMRAELWRRMIPKEVPLDGAINFHELAKRYELSGGFIRNIVLRAAYMAVSEGGGIGMRHLLRAAKLEYSERGSLIEGGRLA